MNSSKSTMSVAYGALYTTFSELSINNYKISFKKQS